MTDYSKTQLRHIKPPDGEHLKQAVGILAEVTTELWNMYEGELKHDLLEECLMFERRFADMIVCRTAAKEPKDVWNWAGIKSAPVEATEDDNHGN